MHVVATAGHVDHGKSTLVRALTGHEPDRLAEERARGLSIELGFAWTTLEGAGEVAFVDVPGHQRFVTTALAGLGPVPVVLFVVAADDPWMPQAEEHLAALDALGVAHGVLVVTRADLADPVPAQRRAEDRMAGTSLAGLPAVAVSGRTGAGLDQLRATLEATLVSVPAPDDGAAVRLWVDRRFHIRGAGTVVTGTLPAGTIEVGDQLEVAGERVRVRGIESLEVRREVVHGVSRVALDLGGRAPEAVVRGIALTTPGAFTPARELDVRLTGAEALPEHPVLHVGSASQQVRARPLAGDYVRLRLSEPLPLRAGDRAVLRDPGDRAVWGIEVLDVDPPELQRRGAAKLRAKQLAGEVDEPSPPQLPEPPPTEKLDPQLNEADEVAVERLRAHLADNPFAAPGADELTALGIDADRAARLHRSGHVLRVAPGILLLPGADVAAVDVLARLASPFTTSAARQALSTSRRVVLPLLQHLDKTGRTVRLADDTRRLRHPLSG